MIICPVVPLEECAKTTLTNMKTNNTALGVRGGNISISHYLLRRTLLLSFSIRLPVYTFIYTSEKEHRRKHGDVCIEIKIKKTHNSCRQNHKSFGEISKISEYKVNLVTY